VAVRDCDQSIYPRFHRLWRSSGNFPTLVSFRVLQGFAGGALIPAVFPAVFLLLTDPLHPIATTMAGIIGRAAPTVGPVVGGWITETYSWHWLFLINVAPGVVRQPHRHSCCRMTDLVRKSAYARRIFSTTLMAVSRASLEIAPEAEAPHDGWLCSLWRTGCSR